MHSCGQLAVMAKWLLLPFTFLLVLHGAVTEGADPCALEGFELTPLRSAKYWNVTLAKEECIVPKGYTERKITGCVVHFSICKPLPRDICGNSNSSTCEVVTTSDKKTHYFNIGSYKAGNEFQTTGGAEVGFATIRQGDVKTDSASCNDTYETIMAWTCQPAAIWDHKKSVDVTRYSKSNVDLGRCSLELSLNYSGACYVAPTLPPNKCQLNPFNFTGLESEDYWFASLPNSTCLAPNATSCTVYFSFCQGLPLSLGDGCYEAAVCQTGMNSDGGFSYSLGQLNKQTEFMEANQFAGGVFYMAVEDGDNSVCTASSKPISTRIVLVCNSSARWNEKNLTDIVHVSVSECQYTILLPYAGACLPITPNSTHSPTMTPSPSTTSHPNGTKTMTSSGTPITTSTKPSNSTSTMPSSSTHGHSTGTSSGTSPTKTRTANPTTASHTTVMPTRSTTSSSSSKTASGSEVPTVSPTTTSSSSSSGSKVPTESPSLSPTTRSTTSTTRSPPSHSSVTTPGGTTPEKPTQPTAKPVDNSKIAGLTAGLVIFMLISVVLLGLLIITAWFSYKRRKIVDYQQLDDSDKM